MYRILNLIVTGTILFMFIVISSPHVYAEEYNLADLYRIALEKSDRIKLSEQDVAIAEIGKQKAIAYLNPTLTAYGSYTRYTDDKYTDPSTIPLPAPINRDIIIPGSLYQPHEATNWGVRMDYRFSLSGNPITAYNIAKTNITKSKHDLQYVKDEYLFQVANAYYDYLKYNKLQEIAGANVERLLKYRNAAEKRLKVGEVTKTVLLRAESELSNSQSELVKAKNGVILAKANLSKIVGIDEDSNIKETPTENGVINSVSYYQDLALSKRSDIRSMETKKKIAQDQVKYNKGFYWPYLSLAGVYNRNEQTPAAKTLNKKSLSGIVGLNFPFYEGGLRVAEVKEAKAKEKQAELLYEDLVKVVMIEIQSIYLDLQTQTGILKFYKDQLSYARDNYYAVSKQFEFGLATSIDVLDATTTLVAAELKMAEAAYNYQVALLRMKKATGIFSQEVMSDKPELKKEG
jgi:outer membrane protein